MRGVDRSSGSSVRSPARAPPDSSGARAYSDQERIIAPTSASDGCGGTAGRRARGDRSFGGVRVTFLRGEPGGVAGARHVIGRVDRDLALPGDERAADAVVVRRARAAGTEESAAAIARLELVELARGISGVK